MKFHSLPSTRGRACPATSDGLHSDYYLSSYRLDLGCRKALKRVFSNQFGSLQLPETRITLDEVV